MPVIPISVSQELATAIGNRLPTSRGRNDELALWLAGGLQAREKGIPLQLEFEWSKVKWLLEQQELVTRCQETEAHGEPDPDPLI